MASTPCEDRNQFLGVEPLGVVGDSRRDPRAPLTPAGRVHLLHLPTSGEPMDRKSLLRSTFILGTALAVTVTAALAGNGVGGVFNLGQINTVNGSTELRGTTGTQQLMVRNSSTAISSVAVTGLSVNGTGVWGRSSTRYGVKASASGTSGINYGIYAATASANGFAGYFQNTATHPTNAGTGIRALGTGATPSLFQGYLDAGGRVRRAGWRAGPCDRRRWRCRGRHRRGGLWRLRDRFGVGRIWRLWIRPERSFWSLFLRQCPCRR